MQSSGDVLFLSMLSSFVVNDLVFFEAEFHQIQKQQEAAKTVVSLTHLMILQSLHTSPLFKTLGLRT